MIELTRRQILVLRSTIRQSLGLTGTRRSTCCITFQTTPEELTVSARHGELAITWRVPGQYQPDLFALPIEALAACEGRQNDVVRIEQSINMATLRWNDAGIPQSAEYTLVEPVAMPEVAENFVAVGHEFLTAMAEASATTESGSLRYALSYIRLRGRDGQIAATDSRQALLQSGFQFPWTDSVLVPITGAFTTRAICEARTISLAKTPDWVFLRADTWTVALQIEKERRFPDIDAQLPEITAAQTTLCIAESDAGFLLVAAGRLPGSEDSCAPATLDLNGAVIVRAKSDHQASMTELLLSNSRKQGDELRVSTDRNYLTRAIQLGFREVYLRDPDLPAFCRSDRRAYLWALLGKDAVLKGDATASRIESPIRETQMPRTGPQTPPVSITASSATGVAKGHRSSMTSQPERAGPTSENGPMEAKSLTELIAEGESLRTTLRDVLTKTKALITGLKEQRRCSHAKQRGLRPRKSVQTLNAD